MSEVKRFGYFWDGSFDVKDDGAFIRYEDYAELEKQRDMYLNAEASWEKAMMAAIGEDGTGSVAKAIAELKAQRDALAVENAALKDYLKECSVVQGEGNWTSDAEKSVYVPASEWNPPTPATAAYLNSLRAEGAASVGTLIRACAHEFPDSAEDIVEECAMIADNRAISLRAVRDK